MQDPRINSKEPLENKESRWIGLYKLEYSDPKGNKRVCFHKNNIFIKYEIYTILDKNLLKILF